MAQLLDAMGLTIREYMASSELRKEALLRAAARELERAQAKDSKPGSLAALVLAYLLSRYLKGRRERKRRAMGLDGVLSGGALMAALRPVRRRHDELAAFGGADSRGAYQARAAEVQALVAETAELLRGTRISDKAVWTAHAEKAAAAVRMARQFAQSGEWGRALAAQEYAVTAAHHVLDAMRGLARRTGAKDTTPPYKPGDTITLRNGRKARVVKCVPAENLFHEPEWHVLTDTGDALVVKEK